MDSTAVAIALSVSGAAFELAGLALVALGIHRDRAHADRLFARREHRQPPQRSYPGRQSPTPPLASYGEPSGREIRAQIGRLEAGVANVLIGIRKAVDAELDRSVAAIYTEINAGDDLLRDNLRYVLAGSIRERVAGVILLGVGILLAVAGSVVGTLA